MVVVKRLAVLGAVLGWTPANATDAEVIQAGFRIDALPFSYDKRYFDRKMSEIVFEPESGDAEARGFVVEVCREIAELYDFDIEFVPVTSSGRFQDLSSGKIDLLCDVSSVTVERLRTFDVTPYLFASGVSILSVGGESYTGELQGFEGKLGVVEETTAAAMAKRDGLEVDVFPSYLELSSALVAKKVSGALADREILLGMNRYLGSRIFSTVSSRYYSLEPYALFFKTEKRDLRVLFTQGLAALAMEGRIIEAFFEASQSQSLSSFVQVVFDLQKLVPMRPRVFQSTVIEGLSKERK